MLSVCKIALFGALILFNTPLLANMSFKEGGYIQVIEAAIGDDPLITAQQKQARAYKLNASTNQQLADSVLGLHMNNVPINDFDLTQDPMTQLKLSISQALPRGDTLKIGGDIQHIKSRQYLLAVKLRKRQLALDVGNHWLSLHLAYTNRFYVGKNYDLIVELIEVMRSQYAVGNKSLRDIIEAEVQLSRLALQVSQLDGRIDQLRAEFSRWLDSSHIIELDHNSALPSLNINHLLLTLSAAQINQRLLQHPQLQIIQQGVAISSKNTELAKQQFQPAYTLQASYGLRGNYRADLFNVGVNFQMPLFNVKKLNNAVEASILQTTGKRFEKTLQQQQMYAAFMGHKAQLQQLQRQFSIYQDKLLKQLEEQSESALAAYNSDSGDFSVVIESYLDQMQGDIEFAQLKTALLKKANQINFLLPAMGL
jgi:outer membrane protein TolC